MTRFRTIAVLLFSFSILQIAPLFADAPPTQQPAQTSLEKKLIATLPGWTKARRLMLYVKPMMPLTPPGQGQTALTNDVADLSSPEVVAKANGYSSVWFGRILAIAPSTTTVLSTDPGLAELPIDQIGALHPHPMLLGSLTNAQFSLLATVGLGMNDLTPDQQTLFRAILPNPFEVVSLDAQEPFIISPKAAPTASEQTALMQQYTAARAAYQQQVITVPQDDVLRHVLLHAYLNVSYALASSSGSNVTVPTYGDRPYSSGDRKLVRKDSNAGSFLPSANLSDLLVAQLPNVPKSGDLRWSRRELSAEVSIDGAKTVDDLVNKIAKATHLELYADTSYGDDSVLVGGDIRASQPASSLLRALALCVNGTWRQVGPAYVLTDDETGLAVRQQYLRDVVSAWGNRLADVDADFGVRLLGIDWVSLFDTFPGDSTDLPKSQLINLCGADGTVSGKTTWKSLPPTLQNAITTNLGEISEGIDNNNAVAGVNNNPEAELLKNIRPDSRVQPNVDLEIALELPNTGIMALEECPVDTEKFPAPALKLVSGPVTLHADTRGALCSPKTAIEARTVVDRLPSLGLNTLFLDVFNNGRAYFANSAIPAETDDAAGVLPAALDEASKKGIVVYAVVDSLCWRKDGKAMRPAIWPAQLEEDVNVFGEPSEKGVERRIQQNIIHASDPLEWERVDEVQASDGWVNPLDPAVRQALPGLIKDLAGEKGIVGIVFQDTVPPGYGTRNPNDRSVALDLGYTLSNRLAFLRRYHIDPVDETDNAPVSYVLPWEGIRGPQINIGVYGFRGYFPGGLNITNGDWNGYRSSADLSLLQTCYLAAQKANPKLALLLRDPNLGTTIDVWTDPSKSNDNTSDASTGGSKINVLTVLPILRSAPARLPGSLNRLSRNNPAGIVLDIETGGITDDAPQLLSQLTSYLQP